MDNYIMKCWNTKAQPDDMVYIIGDVCYRSSKGAEWYQRRLLLMSL